MIRHIVMFKLKEFAHETEKLAAILELKKRLDELPLKISQITRCEVGVDIRKLEWSYDIVLVMDFNTMDDLNTYTIHPAHQKFIAFNKDFTIAKASADYEF